MVRNGVRTGTAVRATRELPRVRRRSTALADLKFKINAKHHPQRIFRKLVAHRTAPAVFQHETPLEKGRNFWNSNRELSS